MAYQPIYCFKPSSDDWYGNFKIEKDGRYTGHFVYVGFMVLESSDVHKKFRVRVQGNDDCFMDFDTDSAGEAKNVYDAVGWMHDVTKDALFKLGFVV